MNGRRCIPEKIMSMSSERLWAHLNTFNHAPIEMYLQSTELSIRLHPLTDILLNQFLCHFIQFMNSLCVWVISCSLTLDSDEGCSVGFAALIKVVGVD